MKVLELKNVKKNYLSFQLDVNFALSSGETIGLVGKNGAGKTTIINIILNIVKKDSGIVEIFGQDHILQEDRVKERMGVVLEDHYFYKNFKIDDILNFASSLYSNWDIEYSMHLRQKFGLNENKKYKELSKGMKVKLSTIIALSHKADLLIFDEPTSGLDPKVRNDLLEEILDIKRKRNSTMLFASHNMKDIEMLSDRIIMIDEGKIILDEKKKELNEKWRLVKFYCKDEIDFSSFSTVRVMQSNNNYHTLLLTQGDIKILKMLNKIGVIELTHSHVSMEEAFLILEGNRT